METFSAAGTDTYQFMFIASRLGVPFDFQKKNGVYVKVAARGELAKDCKLKNGNEASFDMTGYDQNDFADYADVCVALWRKKGQTSAPSRKSVPPPKRSRVNDDDDDAVYEQHHTLAVEIATPSAYRGADVINSGSKAVQANRDERSVLLNSITTRFQCLNTSLESENRCYRAVNDGLQVSLEYRDDVVPLLALHPRMILALNAPPRLLALPEPTPIPPEAERMAGIRAAVAAGIARRAAIDEASSGMCGGSGTRPDRY